MKKSCDVCKWNDSEGCFNPKKKKCTKSYNLFELNMCAYCKYCEFNAEYVGICQLKNYIICNLYSNPMWCPIELDSNKSFT